MRLMHGFFLSEAFRSFVEPPEQVEQPLDGLDEE